jgi:hypothetical protein
VPPTSLDDPSARPDGPRAASARGSRRSGEPDPACAAAVDLARQAALEEADPGTVGEHLGVTAEGDRVVTHSFANLARGYHGWRWAVTVARAPRSRHVTVSEVVLLPDRDAVVAPAWVPWSDRLAPGDLGATDALPYRADDPYLEQGYTATGDEDEDRVALWELGLGRPRVLSREGREAAATRWYTGDRGPTAEEAIHAAAACASCGYFVLLPGSLRLLFGVCANAWSPSDGKVVSVDHGCGAHSETDVEIPEPLPLPEPVLDETLTEAVALPPRTPVDEVPQEEPAVSEEQPAVPEGLPAVSEELPAVSEEQPAVSEEVPAVSEELPAAPGDQQVAVEQGPVEEAALVAAVAEVAAAEEAVASEAGEGEPPR